MFIGFIIISRKTLRKENLDGPSFRFEVKLKSHMMILLIVHSTIFLNLIIFVQAIFYFSFIILRTEY